MPSTKKTFFQDDSSRNLIYEKCIRRVSDNVHTAQCILCRTSFGLSNMGKGAVDSHISGKKHQKAILVLNSSYSIRRFGSTEQSSASPNENQNHGDTHNSEEINNATSESNVRSNIEETAATKRPQGVSVLNKARRYQSRNYVSNGSSYVSYSDIKFWKMH